MKSDFDISDFGAVGDGRTNDTKAIQTAIDACHAGGGGRVVLSAGNIFLSGSFRLKSHVDFHVESGASLIASDVEEDYPNRVLIEAMDAQNISITGAGVIDGRAKLFMTEELPHIYRANSWRPRLIALTGCKGVKVTDITLKDSANWGLHLSGCENVLIHGIAILNDLKVPNCDGIDPDRCRNVRISDCHIEAGDDCIVLKATRPNSEYGAARDYGPCENITVTGCTLISTSCAIKIGSESVGDIRNVLFDSCIIRGSSRGLGIMLRDEGNIENVIFSNMVVETRLFADDWWGRAEPIYVTSLNRAPGTKLGRVKNIRFSNILCKGESGVFLRGCPESILEDIQLENIKVEIDKWTRYAGGSQDLRPCAGEGLTEHRTAGIFCRNARDVTLRHCKVVWGENRPDYFGHALEVHDVEGLALEGFRGEAAHPERDSATLID